MSLTLFVRLWFMVFLHYFVWGTWYVTMGTYLHSTLKFEGGQIGLAYGSTAIGAMVSPFFAGIVADRFFATQRLLGTLHLIGAALLWYVSTLKSFGQFYPVLIAYTISYMAGHGLTNALTLAHSKNPAKEFPLVMMMGSVGWIAAGFAVSKLKFENNAGMFQLAAGAALVMGLYSFTLPHTPPKGAGVPVSLRTMLGLDALKLMRDRSFATFMICSFLICVPLSFYFSLVHICAGEAKIEEAAMKLTGAQVSDVVFLLLLPFLLKRLGVKGILILGMIAWTVRFGLLAQFDQMRDAVWLFYLAIAVHGMCYDYIFVMGRMYVDNRASEDIRAATQGFHAFVTLGAGMFVGSWLSGVVGQHYTNAGGATHNWSSIWLVPAVMSAVLIFVFAVLFKDNPPSKAEEPAQS
ncbi:MAG: Nucleoside H+ symporter [Limisphaerales bacterium]|nr:MAG: Nucleoside H+ symporter [Limisphaerales bacterium]KAG0508519.1 MAG: Nucleoside H+ symporter [Limisphaerales bacterium]TXT46581.1 MAG: Nucleoside H+ symporter [Limisphaerales bacterium]